MSNRRAEILYSIAKDSEGNLVKAKDAEKGQEFKCPSCEEALILRKSGKTGPNSKRPHFAHKATSPNCKPETVLHFGFKTLACELLSDHLKEDKPFNFNWNCDHCGKVHSGNLLKKTREVALEYNLGDCRPDIALLNRDNQVYAVIEVVVTHAPEQKTLDYYQANEIILLRIDLTDDLDLDRLEKKLSSPDHVDFCTNPRCTACRGFQTKLFLKIIEGPCWQCAESMKVACVVGEGNGWIMGKLGHEVRFLSPEDFSKEQLDLARSKGGRIEEVYSKTDNSKYLANVCQHCNAFAGRFYLDQTYIFPSENGQLDSQEYQIEPQCDHCLQDQHN